MTKKDLYIKYCEQNELPLFVQASWLDLVCNTWDVVYYMKNDVECFLPYTLTKKYGFKFIFNPYFTPYREIVCFENGKCLKNYTIENDIIEKLFSSLPKHHVLEYDFATEINFLSREYKLEQMHTNILDLKKNEQEIFANFKDSCKRQLKKSNEYEIIEEESVISLNLFLSQVYQKQNSKSPYSNNLLKSIVNFCIEKKIGKLFTITNKSNIPLASVLLVWDNNRVYNLICASNYHFANSGAMNGLLWHSIKYAKSMGKNYFDFEGSMHDGIDNFYKTFGAQQIHYTRIKKENKWIKLLQKFKTT